MRVIYCESRDVGWHPITHMVRLLAELFGAQLVITSPGRVAKAWRRIAGVGPRRRGREICLVVAAEPRQLVTALGPNYRLRGYACIVGWVIDSFWVDRIPNAARHFDQLFITDKELVGAWQAETGVPVAWLPWGSDALRLGSGDGDRTVDLQRLGRQPPGWEDDEETRRACASAGLRFEGRPPMYSDATENQVSLMRCLGRAKMVLAFSSAVSPASYTHPTHEYLTGRWTDSLASGAVVAGIAPRSAATTQLLWPSATLELTTTDPVEGLEQIVAAVRGWVPEVARDNHRRALEQLDWRWRFKALADVLDLYPEPLETELESLAVVLKGH